MKRILTMTLAAALLICALSLPAMAESTETTETTATTETTTETTDAVSSATRNNRNNQAAPQQKPGRGQKPGRNGQQQQAPNQGSQQPQAPNQGSQQPQTPDQNAQQPQTPNQNGQQPQAPGQNGGNRKHDNAKNGRTGKSGAGLDLDQLLKENVISQDVYDAIINYLNSLATLQQSTESSTDSAGTT